MDHAHYQDQGRSLEANRPRTQRAKAKEVPRPLEEMTAILPSPRSIATDRRKVRELSQLLNQPSTSRISGDRTISRLSIVNIIPPWHLHFVGRSDMAHSPADAPQVGKS